MFFVCCVFVSLVFGCFRWGFVGVSLLFRVCFVGVSYVFRGFWLAFGCVSCMFRIVSLKKKT